MRILIRPALICSIFSFVSSLSFVSAQTAAAIVPTETASQSIALPAPQTTGGMPLMQALNNRQTTRVFKDQSLSMQQLSNLLWAGNGVNRPQGPNNKPGRTAPSGRNLQDIDLYVVLAQGAYLYDAFQNQLNPVAAGDLRAKAGSAAAVHAAAIVVFVAPAKDDPFAQVDTGFVGQNLYLFAASEGLNAWFYVARDAGLAAALKLGLDKLPLYAEAVGLPEK
jgi:Nitroreductase family